MVVAPEFGDTDVLGMNFLSRLKSWHVDGDVLVAAGAPEGEVFAVVHPSAVALHREALALQQLRAKSLARDPSAPNAAIASCSWRRSQPER